MASKNNPTKYQLFRNLFGKLHEGIPYEVVDRKASLLWKDVKSDPDGIKQLMLKTQADVDEKKSKKLRMWSKFTAVKPKSSTTTSVIAPSSTIVSTSTSARTEDTVSPVIVSDDTTTVSADSTTVSDDTNSVDLNERETPKQNEVKKEIIDLQAFIVKLGELNDLGLSTPENKKQLKESRIKLKEKQRKLKLLVNDSIRQRKRRAERSTLLKEMVPQNEEAKRKLKKFTHDSPGRPSLEEAFPNLREAIIELATAGAGADGRRRTNILQACKTLDGMNAALKTMGYDISRQALYYRFVPHRANSEHGKRHIKTVPVKLAKARNTSRNRHEDASFTFATKGYLQGIASHFGPDSVFAVSIDDKAKVPIGITAAKLQAPLVMHMEYGVRLPDHDFVKAPKHKLIPSVYAACHMKSPSSKKDAEITYSGPMYISIRSLKHESSTAYTHGSDFDTILSLDAFKDEAFIEGQVKPIILAFVDGGPDENPRYPKVQEVAIDHFKKYNLDAYIVMTLASGMSAYNYVERRMAPLSKALAGVLLPHDTYGNHLDSEGKTTDTELEKKNFQKAGESLAEIWGEMIIDGFPVVAEFVENRQCDPSVIDESWISRHCRLSKYMLQIIKCSDPFCCSKMRTSWDKIFINRFLPAPVPSRIEKTGTVIPDIDSVMKGDRFVDNIWRRLVMSPLVPPTKYDVLPYDFYCPSLNKKIESRVCNGCGIYYPSKAAVDRHRRGLGCLQKKRGLPSKLISVARPDDSNVEPEINIDETPCNEEASCDNDDPMPVITLKYILENNPFIEIDVEEEDSDMDTDI